MIIELRLPWADIISYDYVGSLIYIVLFYTSVAFVRFYGHIERHVYSQACRSFLM